MSHVSLLVVALAALAFALYAQRIAQSIVTGPMVFLALGLAIDAAGGVEIAAAENILHVLAEITLVLVLFSDAATIDFAKVRRNHLWPERMLLLAIPLAIVFAFAVAWLLLPGWPVWEIALLAAILAPTDAALGQAVVTNAAVPERIRQTLAIESGLNDGLTLPVVLFFASMAVGDLSANGHPSWLLFAAQQIGLGTLVGVAVGALGALALSFSAANRLTDDAFEGIAVLGIVATCYFLAHILGGNEFLAAFTGGLAFGAVMRGRCAFVFEFMDSEGQLLVLGTFLLLGATLAPAAIASADFATVALILLSLFAIRPLAVWLSLWRTDARPLTKLFLGWFGPRGLATALFALLVLSEFDLLQRGDDLLNVAILAVLVSALLHGLSAAPAARWIARREKRGPSPSE